MPLTLQLLPGEFAVCRLPPAAAVPAWSGSRVFSSVTRTGDELSIICPAAQVPADVQHEAGWRLVKIQGPFAFTETGILASVLAPLAAAKIGVLAVATFDTDHVLVKAARLEEALHRLVAAGHKVQRDAVSPGIMPADSPRPGSRAHRLLAGRNNDSALKLRAGTGDAKKARRAGAP